MSTFNTFEQYKINDSLLTTSQIRALLNTDNIEQWSFLNADMVN